MDRLNPRFNRRTIKHLPQLMAWGCSSWKGRGALEWLENGEMMIWMKYRQILDKKLELFIGST